MRCSLARLAVILLTAACAACLDGSVRDEAGTYVLRTVGDSTVPFARYQSGDYRIITVADTIVLDGEDGARESSVARIETSTNPGTDYFSNGASRYAMRGDTVEFVFTCPPNAMCASPGVGYKLVAGGMVTFPLDRSNAVATSRFEKIR